MFIYICICPNSLRQSSHYAVCTDSGVIFRSSRIVCASVNAVIAPGTGTKQPSRDRSDEVISARLQTRRVPIQRSVKAKRAGNGTHLLLCSKNFSAATARRAERGDRRAAETHPICVGPRAALSVRSATQSYALLASGSAAQSAAPRTGSSRPGNIGLFFSPLIVA